MKLKSFYNENKLIFVALLMLVLAVCAYFLPTGTTKKPKNTDNLTKDEKQINYVYYKDQYRAGIPSSEGWEQITDKTVSGGIKIGNSKFGAMQINRYDRIPKEITASEYFEMMRVGFNKSAKENDEDIEYVFDDKITTFDTKRYTLYTQRLAIKKPNGEFDLFLYFYLYNTEKYSYIMLLICDKELLKKDSQYAQDVNHILYTFEILKED